MMTRAAKKATIIRDHKKEPLDFISRLPNEVLIFILSFLPIDEAVRSSVLSKRWRFMWKQISHLDFDFKHMIYPLTRLNTSPDAHLDFILHLDKAKGIYRYSILFFLILRQHFGDLTSCRFLHFPHDNVGIWIQLLVEKKEGLKDLTLECEPIGIVLKQNFPMALDGRNLFSSLRSLELIRYSLDSPSPFVACKNLRTLKLKETYMKDETINGIMRSCVSLENFTLLQSFGFTKIKIRNSSLKFLELNFLYTDEIDVFAESLEVLVLASLSCPAKNLVLGTPNLRVFHCYCNRQIPLSSECPVLKTQEILEYCSGLLESKRGKIFQNLSSMSVDLDLNNTRDALSLSCILRASFHLQTLRIVIPVNKRAKLRIPGTAGGALPYPISTFWEGREICKCVRRKLKFVYVEGFTGMDLEVDFIKYLIVRSKKLKTITIVCNCSMEDANELLSLRSASANLSIKLNAAKESWD